MGGVAQLGERLPCTQEVIGSIPFTSILRNLQVSNKIKILENALSGHCSLTIEYSLK